MKNLIRFTIIMVALMASNFAYANDNYIPESPKIVNLEIAQNKIVSCTFNYSVTTVQCNGTKQTLNLGTSIGSCGGAPEGATVNQHTYSSICNWDAVGAGILAAVAWVVATL